MRFGGLAIAGICLGSAFQILMFPFCQYSHQLDSVYAFIAQCTDNSALQLVDTSGKALVLGLGDASTGLRGEGRALVRKGATER